MVENEVLDHKVVFNNKVGRVGKVLDGFAQKKDLRSFKAGNLVIEEDLLTVDQLFFLNPNLNFHQDCIIFVTDKNSPTLEEIGADIKILFCRVLFFDLNKKDIQTAKEDTNLISPINSDSHAVMKVKTINNETKAQTDENAVLDDPIYDFNNFVNSKNRIEVVKDDIVLLVNLITFIDS